ncbi:PspA-associated protein PspAA [Sphaerisporangium dianthi]|uniref:PspA-associated domain-containing protein n=1 Tax=Sphaerisporangium dianthi TaxID=1436120 RepID=A0ABV9CHS8_9ACTN
MIVRIMGEGQVEVAEGDIDVLNSLDSELEAAIEIDDEAQFRTKLHALLDKVRQIGKPLPDDSLEPSELILPPADASIDEVRGMLGDSGLIPG